MRAVLISIQPKWCELIALGKKTIEVRRTKPKLETPFKVYIYATKPKRYYKISDCLTATDENLYLSKGEVKMSDGFEFWADGAECEYLSGKVIGEFVCDEIKEITADSLVAIYFNNPQESTCLDDLEMRKYADGKNLFLWHISNLVVYDKPKALSEFYQKCKSYEKDEWESDDCLECENPCGNGGKLYLKKPPQSWCYVEELI